MRTLFTAIVALATACSAPGSGSPGTEANADANRQIAAARAKIADCYPDWCPLLTPNHGEKCLCGDDPDVDCVAVPREELIAQEIPVPEDPEGGNLCAAACVNAFSCDRYDDAPGCHSECVSRSCGFPGGAMFEVCRDEKAAEIDACMRELDCSDRMAPSRACGPGEYEACITACESYFVTTCPWSSTGCPQGNNTTNNSSGGPGPSGGSVDPAADECAGYVASPRPLPNQDVARTETSRPVSDCQGAAFEDFAGSYEVRATCIAETAIVTIDDIWFEEEVYGPPALDSTDPETYPALLGTVSVSEGTAFWANIYFFAQCNSGTDMPFGYIAVNLEPSPEQAWVSCAGPISYFDAGEYHPCVATDREGNFVSPDCDLSATPL